MGADQLPRDSCPCYKIFRWTCWYALNGELPSVVQVCKQTCNAIENRKYLRFWTSPSLPFGIKQCFLLPFLLLSPPQHLLVVGCRSVCAESCQFHHCLSAAGFELVVKSCRLPEQAALTSAIEIVRLPWSSSADHGHIACACGWCLTCNPTGLFTMLGRCTYASSFSGLDCTTQVLWCTKRFKKHIWRLVRHNIDRKTAAWGFTATDVRYPLTSVLVSKTAKKSRLRTWQHSCHITKMSVPNWVCHCSAGEGPKACDLLL